MVHQKSIKRKSSCETSSTHIYKINPVKVGNVSEKVFGREISLHPEKNFKGQDVELGRIKKW